MFPVNNSHFLLRRLVPSGSVRILMYHGFTEERECRGIRNYGGKHLQIEKFEEQMRYLDRHCRVIPLEDGIEAFRGRQKNVPQSVILTMDDGYGSNYALAYPVLKRYGMPATIFVSTDFVEKKDFLWMDRVEYAIDRTTQHQLRIECRARVRRLDLKTVEERKTAASLIDTYLAPERIRKQGIFNTSVIEALVGSLMENRTDTSWQLWNLIAFQAWHDSHMR